MLAKYAGQSRNSSRRQATVLALVIACLAVVSTLSMAIVAMLHQGHQAQAQHQTKSQTRQLASAGIARAKAQLALDEVYEGEVWQVDGDSLPGHSSATVEINVGSSEPSAIVVVATLGEAPHQVKITLHQPIHQANE